jgi:hypothetical protein
MISQAQKKARENFKKAIDYRKKTGCSLKQAFAYVKGKKVAGYVKTIKKGNKTDVIYTKAISNKKAAKPEQQKLFGVKKKAAPKNKKIGNWYDHKPFTLTHLKKIHKEFFRNGYETYFFVKAKKLIISKKLDCQVYIEKQNVPYLGVLYTARKVLANGKFGETKSFSNISELENYVDKHINF